MYMRIKKDKSDVIHGQCSLRREKTGEKSKFFHNSFIMLQKYVHENKKGQE